MAVLAPPDWPKPLRDSTMDLTSSNNTRQRASPASDSSQLQPQHHAQQQQQQQQYPFTVQQQPLGSWTPSIAAPPFYPAFHQNLQQPQQPYPLQLPQQQPYFDHAANAQFAQWAYQQMMFSAQQGFPMMQPQHHSPQQRSPVSAGSNEYFAQNQIPSPAAFNPFPSGTPPPHRGQGDHQHQQNGGQYSGFHPYRRPSRQLSNSPDTTDWRSGGTPHPPYARPDASSSSSSVNSSSSHRQRTNSNQSGNSGHNSTSNSANASIRSRNGPPSVPSPSSRSSPSSGTSSANNQSTSSPARVPHHRNPSSSSSTSTATSVRSTALSPALTTATASPTSSPSVSLSTPRPVRPSPLSQGTFTAAEKRMSRDDSELDPTPTSSMLRSGGLKGRLKRALSFNSSSALKEEDLTADEGDDSSIRASPGGTAGSSKSKSKVTPSASLKNTEDDGLSTATMQTKKRGRAASLFNSRLNASTDNISLSSTVSSASVMIRKLGSMGRLARRNSLAGIASLFKDKDKDKDNEGKDKKGKKKDKKGSGSKGEASEASVSHVTAELDRVGSDWNVTAELSGLSPAAKLARQHTLKSNQEAAAKAKAQQEAAAAAAAAVAEVNANAAKINGVNGISAGVPAWDKNTATRQGSASPVKGGGIRVNEDGTRVLVEDDDDDDRSDEARYGAPQPDQAFYADGWEDDDDWGEGDEDEDVTIRVNMGRPSVEEEAEEEEHEVWAVDIRRSIERTRKPAKGILKNAASYNQSVYLSEPYPAPTRARSNSYNSHPGQSELGPLARMPSPDPDHIDGLHRHPSHSSQHGNSSSAPIIPPLPFESSTIIGSLSLESTKELPLLPSPASASPHSPHPHPAGTSPMFSHPNSSAPALSTVFSAAPMLTHRSATAPHKRLAFASNLAVYDTFSASVYDRRSEPATWSRLTPALAQRIKEELNSYKMEEMEVHASSRIHTQFFV